MGQLSLESQHHPLVAPPKGLEVQLKPRVKNHHTSHCKSLHSMYVYIYICVCVIICTFHTCSKLNHVRSCEIHILKKKTICSSFLTYSEPSRIAGNPNCPAAVRHWLRSRNLGVQPPFIYAPRHPHIHYIH